MSALNEFIACPDCDIVYRKKAIQRGEIAHCQRCNAKLYANQNYYIDKILALNVTALILYVLTISFPFLGIEVNGNANVITLIKLPVILFNLDQYFLALLIALVLIMIPLLRLLGLFALFLSIQQQKQWLSIKALNFTVYHLAPWNMLDIYLIGILVTFVKLGQTADIILGYSFWSFVALVIVVIALNVSFDRHWLWQQLEGLKK